MNNALESVTRSGAAAFWVALIVAALVAYPLYTLLLTIKSRQIVSQYVKEHQKKQGTPTMGGLISMLGICVALALVRDGGALILAAGFALIGLADDYIVPKMIKGNRGLEWKVKLVLQIVVTAGATLPGVSHINILAFVFTLF